MELKSRLLSLFQRVAAYPGVQRVNEHAGKLTSVWWTCGDLYLFVQNALDSQMTDMGWHFSLSDPMAPDKWKTMTGVAFLLGALFLSQVDKNKGAKKIAGGFAIAGGAGLGMAGHVGAVVAPVTLGLSLIFERQFHEMAERMKDQKGSGTSAAAGCFKYSIWGSTFAKATSGMSKLASFYLKYPVLSNTFVQVGSGVSMLASSQEFKDYFYASYWLVSCAFLPMTDENFHQKIKEAAPK